MSFWSRTLSNIKAFPGGLKNVFKETKLRWEYTNRGKHALNRKELDFVRSNNDTLKKLGALLVIQSVPIVGYIPLILAFQFPKQTLTHHFWSPEQTLAFAREEVVRRQTASRRILKELSSCATLDMFIAAHHEKYPRKLLTLDRFTSEELDELATATSICDSEAAVTFSHSTFLKGWLRQRVEELVSDDLMLIGEGWNNLADDEVRAAGVRRGINPELPLSDIRRLLSEWLKSKELFHIRNGCIGGNTEDRHYSEVVLLHAAAFNSVRVIRSLP